MAGKPNGHEKKVGEMMEKAGGAGTDNGFVWVVSTKDRLLGGGERETVSEKTDEKMIRVGVFQTAPARVNINKGLTLNLGNYESARVSVGFEMPCYVEEVKEVTEVVNQMVEDRLQAEVVEVRGKDIRPGFEAKRLGAQDAGGPK